MKVAFFDVDKTLIQGDSLFSLYKFGVKKRPLLIFTLPLILIYFLLYLVRIIKLERVKELIYLPLRFLEKEDKEIFFDKYILGRKLNPSFEELLRLKSEGFYIILVTASSEDYMSPWEERGYADILLGTKTKKNKIIGNNCSGEEKVRRINELFKEKGFSFDFEDSYGFSDSNSDIPMLKLCKTKIRVLKDGSLTPFLF